MTQAAHCQPDRPCLFKRTVMWVLAVLGTVLSAILLIKSIGLAGALPGCGGTVLNCDALLLGRWAKVLGVPTSVPALATYAGILAGLAMVGSTHPTRRGLGWRVLLLTTMLAGGAGIYFLILQFAVESTICPYCVGVHACSLGLLALTLLNLPLGKPPANDFDTPAAPGTISPDMLGILGFTALIGLTLLIAGQLLVAPDVTRQVGTLPKDDAANQQAVAPEAIQAIDDQGRRLFLDGRIAVDPHEVPVYGSPDAAYIVLAIYDYNCPICRKTHRVLEHALKDYAGRLAIIAAPLPMNHQCNKLYRQTPPGYESSCALAKLALAIWRIDPQKFAEFDAFLFEGDSAPDPVAAHAKAAQMVGPVALEAALTDPWIQQQLDRTLDWWTLIPDGPRRVVPMLYTTRYYLGGQIASPGVLYDHLKQSMNIPLPTGHQH